MTPAPRVHGVPASLYGPARRVLTPAMAGRSDSQHVALTLDDGPDPVSTPEFLDLLERRDVRATFFLVGERVAACPDVVRRMADAGHEVAVHGWRHRCVARIAPDTLRAELARTCEALCDAGAGPATRYRPPYGVATRGSAWAAREAGLRPLLWTAWGRDWEARATPESIVHTVRRTLRPGGTVLLHDSDAYSAPGSWRRTLAAADLLLRNWRDRGWPVGPAAEHGRQREGRCRDAGQVGVRRQNRPLRPWTTSTSTPPPPRAAAC